MRRPLLLGVALAAFVLLATANGAGYRFGTSDQAAYVPAVVRALNPATFPRDHDLIDTQGQFFVLDEALATLSRATGWSVPTVFLVAYLTALVVIGMGVVAVGRGLLASWTGTAALLGLVTLRHRIPLTSVNSLEPYFHPRLLAFGLGLLAVAAVRQRRLALAVAAVGAAAVCHVTTAVWFAVLVGTAIVVIDRRWRLAALPAAVVAMAALAWAVAGPLRAPSATMDAVWLQAFEGKDSAFPHQWPIWVWAANLGYAGLLAWVARQRARRGLATDADRGLLYGVGALVALFLVSVPASAAHIAVAVQFQVSRVFWVVEFVTVAYLMALLGDTLGERRLRVIAAGVLALSSLRGMYTLTVEHPERALFQVTLPDTPWRDAMRFIARQPLDTYVVADPGHAWKYGTSVRVEAERDVLLEDVKDSAIAMYSRAIAARVVERRQALGDFTAITADGSTALAARYGLDYLVTESRLDLPVAYRNTQFTVYALRRSDPASGSTLR